MNPLKCDEFQNELLDYLEFELPLSKREKFRDHLTHCSQCRKLHDDMQSVIVDSKAIPVPEPEDGYWESLPQSVLDEVKKMTGALPVSDHGGNESDNQGIVFGGNVMPFARKEITRNESTLKDIRQSADGAKADMTTTPIANQHDHGVHEDAELEAINDTEFLNEAFQGKSIDVKENVKRHDSRSRISWPKIALPIAAAIVVAVGAMFQTSDIVNIKTQNVFYSPANFQASITADKPVSELAQQLYTVSQSPNIVSLSAQQSNMILNVFSLGSMFSETIAYSSANELTLLKTYLQLLKTALARGSVAAENTIVKLEALQHKLDGGTSRSAKDVNKIAYELTAILDGYAMDVKEHNFGHFVLLHAGAWSFDYSLAVLAKDAERLQQKEQIEYFKAELQKINAPVGVTKSLDKIIKSIEAKQLDDSSYSVIQAELDNIRSLLG